MTDIIIEVKKIFAGAKEANPRSPAVEEARRDEDVDTFIVGNTLVYLCATRQQYDRLRELWERDTPVRMKFSAVLELGIDNFGAVGRIDEFKVAKNGQVYLAGGLLEVIGVRL